MRVCADVKLAARAPLGVHAITRVAVRATTTPVSAPPDRVQCRGISFIKTNHPWALMASVTETRPRSRPVSCTDAGAEERLLARGQKAAERGAGGNITRLLLIHRTAHPDKADRRRRSVASWATAARPRKTPKRRWPRAIRARGGVRRCARRRGDIDFTIMALRGALVCESMCRGSGRRSGSRTSKRRSASRPTTSAASIMRRSRRAAVRGILHAALRRSVPPWPFCDRWVIYARWRASL